MLLLREPFRPQEPDLFLTALSYEWASKVSARSVGSNSSVEARRYSEMYSNAASSIV
jgi:hypothetical protein